MLIEAHNYDVMKFWVLGKQALPTNSSVLSKLRDLLARGARNPPPTVYRRVVAAVRLGKDDKLTLKAFKDIRADELEKVLPVGTIAIGRFDRKLIISSLALGSASLLAQLVTHLAKLNVHWPLGLAGAFGLLSVTGYWKHRSRVNDYLSALNNTLYYNNIANNRGLITLVVDRAQDESFKEALLTYTFIQGLSREQQTDSLAVDQSDGNLHILCLDISVT